MMSFTSGMRLYVDTNGSDTSTRGTTKVTPCATLYFTVTSIAKPHDVVELASGVYDELAPGAIKFSSSQVHDLTILSASGDATDVIIQRHYSGRLFEFGSGGGVVRISGIRFVQGGWLVPDSSADYAGGLMRITAADIDVWFYNCRFEGNRNPNQGFAGRGGVGIIVAGTPRFTHCYFADNWGGIAGVFHVASVAAPIFDNCVFEDSGCGPGGWGGAFVPEEYSAGVWRNCVFRNNSCDYGGAIDDGGEARSHFINCTFEKNYGNGIGGAYYGFGNSHMKFTGCRFVGNRIAKGANGQDFYLSSSVVVVFEDCEFDDGEDPPTIAIGASGCVKDNATLAIVNSVVHGYRAVDGTYYSGVESRATFHSTIFYDNSAVMGGAIYSLRPIVVHNCTFERNEASEGGAMYADGLLGSSMSVVGSTFRENTATLGGGDQDHLSGSSQCRGVAFCQQFGTRKWRCSHCRQ